MSAVPSNRIKGLEDTFQTFNQIAQSLETSYHSLEDRVTDLHSQILSSLEDKVEEQLAQKRLNQLLKNVLHALPAGVVVINASGLVQECNPAAVQLLGNPLRGEKWMDVVNRSFTPQMDDGCEVSIKNGRRVSVSTCPLGDEPGQVLLLNDVTETRRLQERLSQYKRLTSLGEMAASLAHQIRTPLSAAILSISQLKNKKLDATLRSEIVEKSLINMRQLENLVNDMLLFSRTGYSGEESIEIQSVLDDLRQTIEIQLRNTRVEFNFRGNAQNTSVLGNKHLLQSALQNISNNAVQAMKNEGTLMIKVDRTLANSIDISVKDTGPGISKECQERVFEPFYTTRSNGTGLGLAVVRAIARAHKGEVWLETEEGKGCEFIMRLPIIQ